ncbi:N-acetylglucosamine-6-phosphate deacetylase, partial [Caldibacillus debilis]
EGTTAFLATTITQSPQAIEKALANAASYIKEQNAPGKAEVVGIHLEGPFINAKRKGAQPEEYILEPDVETFQKWQNLAEGHIRLVTMAPECPNGLELVHYLSKNRCIASIGHSDADYADVKAAVEAGATHVTHLFNGMKGIHHREPGTAGAALLFDELTVELIADGIHVRPEMFRLILQAKGLDRVVLITDAMRAKCLKNGVYDLGGQDVHVRDGKALLSDGTLAGSILKMKDGIKNILAHTSLTLPEAVKLASENPARELGLFDRKGSLEAGKDADLVVLNEQYEPILTICRGAIAFKGEF